MRCRAITRTTHAASSWPRSESLRARAVEANGHSTLVQELNRRIEELRATIDKEPYVFDRRFLFRVLSMGHSQFAEFIGARGPNTQINSACATTTQAVSLAEDWIRAGRCRRVIVISADDVTSDHLIEWIGAGFLASGAAATDEVVEDAAIPFDRRRHGLIIGMGAAALVVESADAARERGIQPICEVLSTVTANSAFHGTRLDVQHIGQVMETLVAKAEAGSGISRQRDRAPDGFRFPRDLHAGARRQRLGGDPRACAGSSATLRISIVIANTKGFTGHAMATGIEDVVAVKALGNRLCAAGGQLQGSRSGVGPVEPVERRRLSRRVCDTPGRRIRFADQHDAVALGEDERRGPSAARMRWATPTASSMRLPGMLG